MKPRFPIYIVSKNRFSNGLTYKVLQSMGINYYIIVEKNQYELYEKYIDKSYGNILVLPEKYLDDYDTFWERNKDNKTGPGAARNFAWDHSIENNFEYHWVMDDNINSFHRLNRNEKYKVTTGTIFYIMEEFVLRYSNISLSGPNYYNFCKTTDKSPPYLLNTRIYSCILINNKIPYRWRGRYNEDTDLSIRSLKDGWVTVQFNAFLQDKVTTQVMKGGNTEEFYSIEGTKNKSQMLVDMHPDITKLKYKFNRWHHLVNYKVFKQKLIYKEGIVIPNKINEYGMKLVNNGN